MVYGTLFDMPSAGLGLQQVLVDSGGLERRKCYGRTAASILGLRDQSARIPIGRRTLIWPLPLERLLGLTNRGNHH